MFSKVIANIHLVELLTLKLYFQKNPHSFQAVFRELCPSSGAGSTPPSVVLKFRLRERERERHLTMLHLDSTGCVFLSSAWCHTPLGPFQKQNAACTLQLDSQDHIGIARSCNNLCNNHRCIKRTTNKQKVTLPVRRWLSVDLVIFPWFLCFYYVIKSCDFPLPRWTSCHPWCQISS